MTPRTGGLNKRVTFQAETRTGDGAGGAASAWSDVVTVWGSFLPRSGRERLAAGRLEASLAGILHVRSSIATRAITEAYRVTIDGVPHDILSIANPDQRNAFLEMTVQRGAGT